MKRVSRVVLDDDQMKQLRKEHEERAAAAANTAANTPATVVDPNLKVQKSETTLHDIYRELQFRKVTQLSDNMGQNTEVTATPDQRPKSPENDEEGEVPRVLQNLNTFYVVGVEGREGGYIVLKKHYTEDRNTETEYYLVNEVTPLLRALQVRNILACPQCRGNCVTKALP
eukprot:sb/3472197/